MSNTISIPEIPLINDDDWDNFCDTYRHRYVIDEGKIKLDKVYFLIEHCRYRSEMLHSISAHLLEEKEKYTKSFSYGYRLLKSAVLEGVFGLRESLSGLVNEVFDLGIDSGKSGSTYRIFEASKDKGLPIADQLEVLVSKESKIGIFLNMYRHPHIHSEDLSPVTNTDFLTAFAGLEQPRIVNFIRDSVKAQELVKSVEHHIIGVCSSELFK
ncbi:MAG: hypothetical protein RAP03_19870 [Candidatus Electryonea clarkiae]|nr:hypothetical protein [Candidatus Electryonea clarkiae]